MSRQKRHLSKRLLAFGPATARSKGQEFYVVSVQRDPETEEPEAPSPKDRTEHRNCVVPVVIERPEITLRPSYVAVRPVPWAFPPTGGRAPPPAAGGRGSAPPRRRRPGRSPAIPAPSALWWRRRR